MRFLLLAVCACTFRHGATPDQRSTDGGGDTADADPFPEYVFGTDSATLARFELAGDVTDSSGNHRDATLIGGSFVPTSFGMGLRVDGVADQGFQWSAYASQLVHPYTIEMVLTPDAVTCWKKLFGPSDSLDYGWHLCTTFQTYPTNFVGPNLEAGKRYYFALTTTSATTFDVFENGVVVGTNVSTSFTSPPPEAIFFRDDTSSSRTENLAGVIEAVRISSVARTESEVVAVAARLAQHP